MAYTNVSFYPASIRALDVQTILPADTTTIKSLSVGGTNGSKIEVIGATSNETSTAHDIALYLTVSATNYLISTIALPANSGFVSTTNTVDILRSLPMQFIQFDSCNNKYLILPSATTLSIQSLVTVSSAKTLTFFATGENF